MRSFAYCAEAAGQTGMCSGGRYQIPKKMEFFKEFQVEEKSGTILATL